MNNNLYHILEANGFTPVSVYEVGSKKLISCLENRQREIKDEARHPNPERDFVVVPFFLIKGAKDKIRFGMPPVIRSGRGGTIKTHAVDGPTEEEFDEILSSMKNPYIVFRRYQFG